ncbi:MAG: hypothetical protein ACKO8G_01985, partial [Actinomycetota bacterium]
TAPASDPKPSVVADGSAAAARAALCDRPPAAAPSPVPQEGTVPEAMRGVIAATERIRGLDFVQPIVPRAVTREGIVEGLGEGFDDYYPRDLYRRRSLAWRTMGLLAPDESIRRDIATYFATGVIGYYDSLSGELVYLGNEDPSPGERVTLAHELVHALDDRTFGIAVIDDRIAACEDEAVQAALAVFEGSATYYAVRYAEEELTSDEYDAWRWSGGSSPPVAPFLLAEFRWPYRAGYALVSGLPDADRERLLADLLTDPPTTTEQVLHPRYPRDRPTPVDVPDRAPALGPGWVDLDVSDAGESWLAGLLGLRLPGIADAAAAGWDGGIYRAFTDGERVAVELATAWDSDRDADEFARAMREWAGDRPIAVLRDGPRSVRVLFGSDAATRDLLAGAVGDGPGVP